MSIESWLNKDRTENPNWRGDVCYKPEFYTGLIDMISNIPEPDKKSMVEIGTLFGESSDLFATVFKKVATVDPYDLIADSLPYRGRDYLMTEIESSFVENVLNNHPNLEKIKGFSVDAAKKYRKHSLDFVYIDADHRYEYVKMDIEAWLPKVKVGGFIGGHDYDPVRFEGVCQAVTECIGREVKVFADTSWLVEVI